MTTPTTEEILDIEVVNEPDVEIEVTQERELKAQPDTLVDDIDDEGNEEEKRRAKGRAERLSRSQKQRAARQRKDEQLQSMQDEIAAMKDHNARLVAEQQRFHQMASQFQSQSLNKEIDESKRLIEYWSEQHSNAIASGDASTVHKLQRAIDTEKQKINNMEQQKSGYDNTARSINPEQVLAEQQRLNRQQSWVSKNSWFHDPRYSEEKSIVEGIDQQVRRDGYDPTTPAYWSELNNRIKRSEVAYVQPDDDDYIKPTKQTNRQELQQRQVVAGSGSGGNAPTSSKKMNFTVNQLSALKHQGIVDQNNRPIPGKEADLKYFHNYWQQSKK